MYASLITIGSEILNGEILNSNSQTLSQMLLSLGIRVKRHSVIEDNDEEIVWALSESFKTAQLVVTTGGLGPTSDDRTRKVIAQWCQMPLVKDENVEAKVIEKIKARGVSLKSTHLIQALKPRQAVFLDNKAGTADGFYLNLDEEKKLLVLPGPPKEIQSILKQGGGEEWLKSIAPKESDKLFMWKCVNVAESDIAEMVEEALKDLNLEIGYRASKPNVYVKVWLNKKNITIKEKLDQLLNPYL